MVRANLSLLYIYLPEMLHKFVDAKCHLQWILCLVSVVSADDHTRFPLKSTFIFYKRIHFTRDECAYKVNEQCSI